MDKKFYIPWQYLIVIAVLAALVYALFQIDPKPAGETAYLDNCASCHMEDGSGLKGLIPPLANADYLEEHKDELACIIRYGMQGEITVNGVIYNEAMAGEKKLTDVEISNIVNYVLNAWGNESEYIPLEIIQKQLIECRE